MKDLQMKETKTQGPKYLFNPQHFSFSSEKTRKKKKKKQHQRDWKYQKNSTLVTGVNMAQAKPHHKKKKKILLEQSAL